ncbi:Glyoxalase/Bleomycin resistance protein/Dihydroxybiphenyl dioxygenase [Leptodontidium sp. 2 PMI_412]|nr:Glyoxalase/Bleomycin resistance protein/Dihydroxybiphenyl dioxygenase [Leptodontidium sp. 2 PMI_412]
MGSTPIDYDSPGDMVMRPSTLAHVFLKTNKYEEMVAYYKKFLGAEARFETSKICFICFDHEHHRIAISAIPGTREKVPSSAGLEHIAFGFNSLQDLALAYRQRKKMGMEPSWCVNHGITISIYYSDPDGNHLETQFDVYEDVDKATEFMKSKEFAANPVGVEFDPEDIVRRLQAGEDPATIMKRDESLPRAVPPHMKKH